MPEELDEHQEFLVRKTTTDKLQRHLNALAADGWHMHPPAYQGGRDWVITGERAVTR